MLDVCSSVRPQRSTGFHKNPVMGSINEMICYVNEMLGWLYVSRYNIDIFVHKIYLCIFSLGVQFTVFRPDLQRYMGLILMVGTNVILFILRFQNQNFTLKILPKIDFRLKIKHLYQFKCQTDTGRSRIIIFVQGLTDWPNSWPTGWPTDWLTEQLTNWLTLYAHRYQTVIFLRWILTLIS